MRVRIRAPNGTHTLNLEDIATVGDLLNEIQDKALIFGEIEVRYGYPPKVLELPSPDTLLIDLPITIHGEQLIVSQSTTSSSKSRTTPGPSSGPLSNSSGTPFQVEEREAPSLSSSIASAAKNFFSSGLSPSEEPQARLAPKNTGIKGNEPVVRVKSNPGWSLTMRVMEDDNSCMFRAVNYAFARGIDMMQDLRTIVATVIQSDADLPAELQKFNDGILGMPRNKYCDRITHPNAWGGYIELTILADYFNMEIWSIDVETGRVDKYNEGQPRCGILVYSGIHYDCIVTSENTSDPDRDVTVFDSYNMDILDSAKNLCRILKERNYATNTGTFTLECKECATILIGEKHATKHNKDTGHTKFEQIE
ncbi:hypothetical protein ABW19_dt0209531 [Dactylella cylindrospora]|nr:hypothetical protein ABW19_dt0209531 [Dactylella cylindrospora]